MTRYSCFLCNYDICSGCAKSMEAGAAPGVQGGQGQRQDQRQEQQEVQQEVQHQEGQHQEVHPQEDLSNLDMKELSMEEEIRQDIRMRAEVRAKEDVFLRCVVENQQGNVQWTKDGFALGKCQIKVLAQ